MSDPRLSSQLFSEALQAKRNGNYIKALTLYKKSILVYPDDPDLRNTFYSMAKVFYLLGEYQVSALSYATHVSFTLKRGPAIITDYRDGQLNNLSHFFENTSHNFGQALAACNKENLAKFKNEILWYRTELSGQDPHYETSLLPFEDDYKYFDSQCVHIGFKEVLSIIDEHSKNLQPTFDKYVNTANKILDIIPD